MNKAKYLYNNEPVVRAADFLTMGCSDCFANLRQSDWYQWLYDLLHCNGADGRSDDADSDVWQKNSETDGGQLIKYSSSGVF